VVLPEGGQEMEMTLAEWQELQPQRSETPNFQLSRIMPYQQSAMEDITPVQNTDPDIYQDTYSDTFLDTDLDPNQDPNQSSYDGYQD